MRKIASLVATVLVGVCVTSAFAADPPAGFLYTYSGDSLATAANAALDGTWDHDNGSDEWDESGIGSGNPGGVDLLNGSGSLDNNFIRIQETGDPRDYSFPDPGSNRKIYFGHTLAQDGIPTSQAIFNHGGFMMEFRARLATPDNPVGSLLDDLHPDGGGGTVPFPVTGDGYIIHDGGKGQFLAHQEPGAANDADDGTISFSLALESDHSSYDGQFGAAGGALVMNNLNGTSRTGTVDSGETGTANFLANIDVTAWHTYTIGIKPDGVIGTHIVEVSVDGGSPTLFNVTMGTGNDLGEENNIGLGMGRTGESGALDVDYFAYKVPEPMTMSLLGLGGLFLTRRRRIA